MQKKTIQHHLTFCLLLLPFIGLAQIPAGYYDDADGKSGYTLKTALYNIIKDHNDQGYSSLWDLYKTSDKRADGYVWDIYSDCDLEFDTDQDDGTGGTTECDKYNREHTFPQSWFGGSGTMRNDPFHVIPADKKVNGIRGNYAYGEVASPTYTSLNGSKLGTNTVSGYSGTVFEPIDEYKGDIARGYFYMATRYENLIAGWENNDNDGDEMLNGTSDKVFEDWALAMLIEWHNADPVSQKEIDRNDAIYDYQDNRNPFIDHPEYVSGIWGGASSASINVNESLIDFGAVQFGDVSDTQSYTLSGSSLSDDITITATNGFEVSLTDVAENFTANLTLSENSGTVSNTTIYIRFNPASNSNSSIAGTITHTSGGAADVIVNVSASEQQDTNPPSITVIESLTDFGQIPYGNVSSTQSYSISGVNLTNDITISSNNGFEISLTDVSADYSTNLTLTQTGGNVSATTVFVRFNPETDANSDVLGTIIHSSNGATTEIVNLSGTEFHVVVPEINFSFSERSINLTNSYEVTLYADQAPTQDIMVYVVKSSSVNLDYGVHYTTTPAFVDDVLEMVWPSGEINSSFTIEFDLTLIDFTDPGSISFSLNDGDDYFFGTNNNFALTLNPQNVINGIDDNVDAIQIYPNPTNNIITVKWSDVETFSYSIMDFSGRLIQSDKMKGNSDIDVSHFTNGNYIFRLEGEKQIHLQKIVIY